MDKDVLLHQGTELFQEQFSRALDALESAPDGRWIAASEEAFRDAALAVMKEVFQAALQEKIDEQSAAGKAAFSPSGGGDDRSASMAEQGSPSGADPDHGGGG
ncbi:MAG: hypothetical protein ACE5JX_22875 [Acidobacteriota bacterium]